MRKLLPIFLALAGTGGGIGAGLLLRPEPVEATETISCGPGHEEPLADTPLPVADPENIAENDYVRLNSQFVVSVVRDEKIAALVVMSLNIEVLPGNTEVVYQIEPRLRDGFLQVMFNHANAGGFDGLYTDSAKMARLGEALLEVARSNLGDIVVDVLIQDFVRQDV